MNLSTKLLRRILLLPVAEAEQRDKADAEAVTRMHTAKQINEDVCSRLNVRAAHLRAVHDDLLRKLK